MRRPRPRTLMNAKRLRCRPERRITKDGREILRGRAYQQRRAEVWERDDFSCVRCGKGVTLDQAHVHHLRKRGMGSGFRTDAASNLQTLCGNCHWREHA